MIWIRDLQPAFRTTKRPAVSQSAKTASGCRWRAMPFHFLARRRWLCSGLRSPAAEQCFCKCSCDCIARASRGLSQRGLVQTPASHQLGRYRCGIDLALERLLEEDRARRPPERLLEVARDAHRVPGAVEVRALQRVDQQVQAQRTDHTPEDKKAHGLALVLELTVRKLLLEQEILRILQRSRQVSVRGTTVVVPHAARATRNDTANSPEHS